MKFDSSSDQVSPTDAQADSEINNSSQKTSKVKQHRLTSPSRRSFLVHTGIFTATSVVTGVVGSTFSTKKNDGVVQAQERGRQNYNAFRDKAYRIRVAAAEANRAIPIPGHPTNGDEKRYPNKIATDTRGLPHDERGEVKLEAYNSLIQALRTGNPNDYENIILGGGRKLVNPQGPLAISLEGYNASQIAIPPAPTLDSAEQAADAVELYWQALLRDVPFTEFQNNTSNPKVLAAVEDLNKLSGYTGPKQNGQITPEILFRGTVTYVGQSNDSYRSAQHFIPPGVDIGPYISQFLLLNVPFGTQYVSPLIRTALPGNDFLIDFQEWLTVQNGGSSGKSIKYDPQRRYIFNGRDLGEFSHIGGALFLGASLILSSGTNVNEPLGSGIGAPLNPGNPYVKSKTQEGSPATFAVAYLQGLLPLASSRAIRASYWQKWYVHRRLRPEAFAGLVYNNIVNKTEYPIPDEFLKSRALADTFSTYGSYLLPHGYPEGAPTHSSYSGGAAAIAGVNVTLLKAFFDENFVIPNPVIPDPNDPTKVIPYNGAPLTVGGELNKLAVNYTLGRNNGGIHWRSDGSTALALGEEIAISILKDERLTFNEQFDGYTFTKFDGTTITV
jgi:hypothetical protein